MSDYDFFRHDSPSATCVCKDRAAHREAGLHLLRIRMAVYDRIREQWPLLTGTPEPLSGETRVGVDWKEIPSTLLARIDAFLDAWKANDRVRAAFDLYDLAALLLVIAEEAAHWNLPFEDPRVLMTHVQRAVETRDKKTAEMIGGDDER